jgi:enamine deaminase RidA (YjgF/YER057c/UK114 family)
MCKPVGPYSHGVIAEGGRFLFIAGQVAWGPDGRIIGKGDFETQARVVMQNIQRILEEAGGSFRNVVKIVNYLKNKDDYPFLKKVRSEFIKEDPPVSTLVQIGNLLEDDLLIEVEAIAVLD